jgi:hypothetical protein
MKRRAYTLAETLLALTIVGALSVLSFTAVNKFKPDTNKIMYLKMHDEILTAVSDIAASYETTLDFDNDGHDDYDLSEYPLLNRVFENDNEDRFVKLMRDAFSGTKSDNGFVTSVNSVYMEIQSSINNSPITEKNQQSIESFYYTITIDINGNAKAPNCSYNNNSCTEPDRFIFYVLPNAEVIVGDLYGRAYLENRQVQNINASILKDREEVIKNNKITILAEGLVINKAKVPPNDIIINQTEE